MLLAMMLCIGVIIGGTASMQTSQEFTRAEEVIVSNTVSTTVEQLARVNQKLSTVEETQEINIFIKVTPSKGYTAPSKSNMKIPEPKDDPDRQFTALLKAQYEQSREEAILASGELAVNDVSLTKTPSVNDTFGTTVDVSISTQSVTSSTSYVTV